MMAKRPGGRSVLILAILLLRIDERRMVKALLSPSYVKPKFSFRAEGMKKARMSSSSENNNASSESSIDKQGGRKRRRKNKYENFSKVDSEIDPLEQMISESQEKNKLIVEEKQKRKNKHIPQPVVPPLQKMAFPDAKIIDPYDPSTFGYVEIGEIIGAHGVYGMLKVKSTTDFPMIRLCSPGIRHLKPAKKRAPRQIVLLKGKHRHLDEFLIQIEGVNDRDAAVRLRGSTIYAREEDKVIPQTDEFIVSDLVGLEVFLVSEKDNDSNHQKEKSVGTVGGVVFAEDITGLGGLGHDMLEIVLPTEESKGAVSQRREEEYVLVPFVPEIVPSIDLTEGAVFIDPPDGLLSLTYKRETKIRIKGFLPPAEAP